MFPGKTDQLYVDFWGHFTYKHIKGYMFNLQLPDKSIASLVKFYYSWKKTRTKTSVMDRHARKQKREREER